MLAAPNNSTATAHKHNKLKRNATSAVANVSSASATKQTRKKSKRQKKTNSKNVGSYVPPHCRPPKLDTPEAVAAWREQRRKRWPTDSVVRVKLDQEPSANQEDVDADADADADAEEDVDDASANASINRPCRFLLHSGKCRAGADCVFSHAIEDVADCDSWVSKGHCKWKTKCFKKHNKAKRAKKEKGNGNKKKPRQPPQRKTLLNKLMVDDQHMERTALLECMSYMMDEQFFVEQECSDSDETTAKT